MLFFKKNLFRWGVYFLLLFLTSFYKTSYANNSPAVKESPERLSEKDIDKRLNDFLYSLRRKVVRGEKFDWSTIDKTVVPEKAMQLSLDLAKCLDWSNIEDKLLRIFLSIEREKKRNPPTSSSPQKTGQNEPCRDSTGLEEFGRKITEQLENAEKIENKESNLKSFSLELFQKATEGNPKTFKELEPLKPLFDERPLEIIEFFMRTAPEIVYEKLYENPDMKDMVCAEIKSFVDRYQIFPDLPDPKLDYVLVDFKSFDSNIGTDELKKIDYPPLSEILTLKRFKDHADRLLKTEDYTVTLHESWKNALELAQFSSLFLQLEALVEEKPSKGDVVEIRKAALSGDQTHVKNILNRLGGVREYWFYKGEAQNKVEELLRIAAITKPEEIIPEVPRVIPHIKASLNKNPFNRKSYDVIPILESLAIDAGLMESLEEIEREKTNIKIVAGTAVVPGTAARAATLIPKTAERIAQFAPRIFGWAKRFTTPASLAVTATQRARTAATFVGGLAAGTGTAVKDILADHEELSKEEAKEGTGMESRERAEFLKSRIKMNTFFALVNTLFSGFDARQFAIVNKAHSLRSQMLNTAARDQLNQLSEQLAGVVRTQLRTSVAEVAAFTPYAGTQAVMAINSGDEENAVLPLAMLGIRAGTTVGALRLHQRLQMPQHVRVGIPENRAAQQGAAPELPLRETPTNLKIPVGVSPDGELLFNINIEDATGKSIEPIMVRTGFKSNYFPTSAPQKSVADNIHPDGRGNKPAPKIAATSVPKPTNGGTPPKRDFIIIIPGEKHPYIEKYQNSPVGGRMLLTGKDYILQRTFDKKPFLVTLLRDSPHPSKASGDRTVIFVRVHNATNEVLVVDTEDIALIGHADSQRVASGPAQAQIFQPEMPEAVATQTPPPTPPKGNGDLTGKPVVLVDPYGNKKNIGFVEIDPHQPLRSRYFQNGDSDPTIGDIVMIQNQSSGRPQPAQVVHVLNNGNGEEYIIGILDPKMKSLNLSDQRVLPELIVAKKGNFMTIGDFSSPETKSEMADPHWKWGSLMKKIEGGEGRYRGLNIRGR